MFRRKDEDENEYTLQPSSVSPANNANSGFPAAPSAPAQPKPFQAANPAPLFAQDEQPAQQTAVPFIKTSAAAPAAPQAPIFNETNNTPAANQVNMKTETPAQAKEQKPAQKTASTVNTFVPSALRASAPQNATAPSYNSPASSFPAASKTPLKIDNIGLETERRLTVGYGISLEGKVSDCDKLVIYGNVNAELNNVKALQISDSGKFSGIAEIDYAEISGSFEGELKVRKSIIINTTGRVSGKITYGSIEIKPGGKFTGEIVEDKALSDALNVNNEAESTDSSDFYIPTEQKAENKAA